MARHIPGAISSPTSHIPLLNVPLPPGGGVVLALGTADAPATAAPGDCTAVLEPTTAEPPPESEVSRKRIITTAASTTPNPPAIASQPRDKRATLARHPTACPSPYKVP